MQRCPKCEFVYEDDQDLCDMDGTKLIHDARDLPRNRPRGVMNEWRAGRKRLPVLLIFSMFLGALLFIPTPRQSLRMREALRFDKQTSTISQPTSTSAVSTASVMARLSTAPRKGAQSVRTLARQRRSREDGRLAGASSRPLVHTASQPNNSLAHIRVLPRTDNLMKRKISKIGEPETNDDRRDSRLASILRKTGRILQRPFKM